MSKISFIRSGYNEDEEKLKWRKEVDSSSFYSSSLKEFQE